MDTSEMSVANSMKEKAKAYMKGNEFSSAFPVPEDVFEAYHRRGYTKGCCISAWRCIPACPYFCCCCIPYFKLSPEHFRKYALGTDWWCCQPTGDEDGDEGHKF